MTPPPTGTVHIHIAVLTANFNVVANDPSAGTPLAIASPGSQSVADIATKFDLQQSGANYTLANLDGSPVIAAPGAIVKLGDSGIPPTPLHIVEVSAGVYRISVAGTPSAVRIDGYVDGSTLSAKEHITYGDEAAHFMITAA